MSSINKIVDTVLYARKLAGRNIFTASHQLDSDDSDAIVVFNNGSSDYDLTFPSDTTDNLEIGIRGELKKTGSGAITCVRDSGVTFLGALGNVDVDLDGADGYSIFWEKTAANTYEISGAIKAEGT